MFSPMSAKSPRQWIDTRSIGAVDVASADWETLAHETNGFDFEVAGSSQGDVAAESFPCKLHLMLDDVERQGLAHIVSWQPHGRCFAVHRRRDFVERVMPVYFRTSKFASFQRQLNIYGFHRLTTGRDKGGYYHELFLKGQRDLSYSISRQKVKGTRVRKPAEPKNEPNFYVLSRDTSSDSMKPTKDNTDDLVHMMGLSSMLTHSVDQHKMTTALPMMDSATTGQLLLALASSGKSESASKSAMRYSAYFKPTLASISAASLGEEQQYDVRTSESRRFSLFSTTSQPWQDFHSAPEPIKLCQQQQLLLQDEIETSIEALLGALAHLD